MARMHHNGQPVFHFVAARALPALALVIALGLGGCGSSETAVESSNDAQTTQESPPTKADDNSTVGEDAVDTTQDEEVSEATELEKSDKAKDSDASASATPAEDDDAKTTALEQKTRGELVKKGLSTRSGPFWGVWAYRSKSIDKAVAFSQAAKKLGFASEVFLTTDWSNLSDESAFVVSLACMDTIEEVEAIRQRATVAGYDEAYIRHSGDHVKE